MRGTVREGQFGDQQGHGEANTAGSGQADHINPRDVGVEVGVLESSDEPSGAENTDGLTEHECEHDAHGHRIGERAVQAVEATKVHAGAEEREDGNANAGGEGAEAVLEYLG